MQSRGGGGQKSAGNPVLLVAERL